MNGQFFCKRFFFVRYFSLFLKTDEWMSFKFFSFLFECLFYYYFVFGYLSVSVERLLQSGISGKFEYMRQEIVALSERISSRLFKMFCPVSLNSLNS